MPHVAVVTRHDDFHAYVVRKLLVDAGARCSILLADSVACVGGLSWSLDGNDGPDVMADDDGRPVDVAGLDVVWWRRLTGEPRIPVQLGDQDARPLVVNDGQAALLGLLHTSFTGTWVSRPEATRLASNKLLQMRAAHAAGLRVPRTLVSQDPRRVREFCAELEDGPGVIVKPVAGAQNVAIMTARVRASDLADDAIGIAPAIYQEMIPGTRHLRVCCFGDAVHTALLTTDTLDWRYPLDATVEPFDLDGVTASRVLAVLRMLDLRMGVVDMKLTPDGEPVWLEVNPQGQFLFLEGMCRGLHLARHFCDFLLTAAAPAVEGRDRTEGAVRR